VCVATPEQPLQEVFQMMGAQNINQVPVVEHGRLVGLLSREAIIRYLQVQQSLQENERQYAV
jgi:predicted transcriptional regulator